MLLIVSYYIRQTSKQIFLFLFSILAPTLSLSSPISLVTDSLLSKLNKGACTYYVINFWTFLDPPPLRNQGNNGPDPLPPPPPKRTA